MIGYRLQVIGYLVSQFLLQLSVHRILAEELREEISDGSDDSEADVDCLTEKPSATAGMER